MREASRSGRVPIQSISVPMSLTESSREPPVVEAQKRFSVAARAAHVREENRDAQLVEVVVVAAEERRLGLRLRPAMDVDHDRPAARELRRRPVQEAGDRPAVEALPAYELRLDEVRRIEPAGLALGPALDLARGRVDRVHVRRRPSRAQRESEILAVLVPIERSDHAHRQRGDQVGFAALGVDQAQPADAVFVRDDGDRAAVG